MLDYVSKATAHYRDIRSNLYTQGSTIGVNDLHMVGYARSEGLTLITNNFREFERIYALRVESCA